MTEKNYLIDTSVWVRLFRRGPPPSLLERVDRLLVQHRVAANRVIVLEVLTGAKTQAESNDYQTTFGSLIELPITARLWDSAAELGFTLRRAGFVFYLPDLLIAATALAHNAILAHCDADFDRMAANCPLEAENWTSLLTPP